MEAPILATSASATGQTRSRRSGPSGAPESRQAPKARHEEASRIARLHMHQRLPEPTSAAASVHLA